ncbi:rhodopsin, GQ-coupled-like [Bombina bombina]|uniref:rhodopsin, GQ-coupled-like n=1 Tax=Bombina bombina TaxID=8345 RepID=UPI00235A48D5|nr:rhodopsin, GQ-coupled-like [Bombina bombina]
MASLNSLVWATVDKFAEICFPLRYTQLITKKRILIILVLLWTYSVVVAALPLMGFGDYTFSHEALMCLPTFSSATAVYSVMLLSLCVLTPITGISVLYISIIHIARYQARRGTFVCNDQHCYYVPIRSYFRNTIILIVSACYLVACWIPMITITFYEIFYAHNVPSIVKMISTWLILLTAGLNPWINSLAQRKYRKALQTSWRKLKQMFVKKGSNHEHQSENERHSSIQSHQCLPGNNTVNSVQT